jgi:hypothetical protein
MTDPYIKSMSHYLKTQEFKPAQAFLPKAKKKMQDVRPRGQALVKKMK